MRYKVHYAYLLAIVTIFIQTWIPRDFNMRYVFLLVLFLLLITRKRFVLKNIVPVYAIPYIVTYISIYLIHFYDGSIFGIVSFVINIIVVRYILINGINSYEEFQRILSIIVDFFTVYSIICIIETFTRVNIIDLIFNRDIALNYGANSLRFNLLRAHGMCTISVNNGILLAMGWGIATYKFLNFNEKKFELMCKYLLIGTATILSLSRTVIIVALGIQLLLMAKRGFSILVKRIAALLLIFTSVYIFFYSKLLLFLKLARQLLLSAFAFIIPSFAKYIDRKANIGDQGARLMLWRWVYDAVKSNLIFGKGYSNPFSKKVLWSTGNGYTIKTSIEVHWLSTLYNGGLFSLTGFIIYQASCIYVLIKNKAKFLNEKISFRYIMIVISICYFISLFTYTGFEDLMYFYLLMALFESYINISRTHFDEKT